MALYTYIPIAVLLFVSLVYAAFDVFNKRNVPNVFVYSTIAVGIAVAVLFNWSNIALDVGIAAAVGVLGYPLYRYGFMGGGDVLEFVFISLVLPIQMRPLYSGAYQFGMPFIVSVLIAAGYASLVFIPIYYLGVKRAGGRAYKPDGRKKMIGALFFAVYMGFLVALKYSLGLSVAGAALITLLAVVSAITIAYEKRIYMGMVSFIYPKELEDGDMIATSLIGKADLKFFRSKTKFGRLATGRLISDLKGVKRKLPVYRDSVPFSLFILIGIIASLLFGNLIFAIVPV